jgi:hypothetical protein
VGKAIAECGKGHCRVWEKPLQDVGKAIAERGKGHGRTWERPLQNVEKAIAGYGKSHCIAGCGFLNGKDHQKTLFEGTEQNFFELSREMTLNSSSTF